MDESFGRGDPYRAVAVDKHVVDCIGGESAFDIVDAFGVHVVVENLQAVAEGAYPPATFAVYGYVACHLERMEGSIASRSHVHGVNAIGAHGIDDAVVFVETANVGGSCVTAQRDGDKGIALDVKYEQSAVKCSEPDVAVAVAECCLHMGST